MKTKPKQEPVVRTAKETSDELFWESASHERDPAKSLHITQQIDKAISKHEKECFRKPQHSQ